MDIKPHISSLIAQEEMVYVPGLGGFMSKQSSARLDTSSHIFHPPSKELAFNDRLTSSDNKLAKQISELEKCSLVLAEQQIEVFVNSIKSELKQHGNYHLEGVGIFYAADQDSISFQGKLSSHADTSSFGLPSILVKSAIQEDSKKKLFTKPKDRNAMSTLDLQSVPDPASPGDNPSSNGKKEPEKNSLTWLYVLTPVVLFGVFGVFLGISDDGKKMLASMHVISAPVGEGDSSAAEHATASELENATDQATIADEAPSSTESFDNAVSADETIKKSANEKWGEEPTKSDQEFIAKSKDVELSTATIITGKSGRYFVIVGGFSKKRNAVKLREKLINEGLESKIIAPIQNDGLYRVSLADFDNREVAIEKAKEFKSNFGNNIWVKSY